MVLDIPEFLDHAEINKFVSMGVAIERIVLSEADKVFTGWLKSGVSSTFMDESTMKTIKLDVVRKIFKNPLDVHISHPPRVASPTQDIHDLRTERDFWRRNWEHRRFDGFQATYRPRTGRVARLTQNSTVGSGHQSRRCKEAGRERD
jgi:hypothetical protein